MPDMRTKKKLHPVIATRALTRAGYDEAVALAIEAPARRRRDWACAFTITGADINVRKTAYGLDALQALLNALELARQTSQTVAPGLSWHEIPLCGLPRSIPLHLDEGTIRRIEALVERATDSAVRRGEAAARKRIEK